MSERILQNDIYNIIYNSNCSTFLKIKFKLMILNCNLKF